MNKDSKKGATKTKGSDRDLEERREVIEYHIKEILEAMDEEVREGLENTPRRVADMLIDEVYRNGDPLEEELSTIFVEKTKAREMIVVRDIPFMSFCEHHLIPYFGVAHIGYLPHMGLIGLSKLARLIQAAGRGFTIQERVTDRVADALDNVLHPAGVIVVIEAVHTCMVVRGIKAVGSSTITSALRGTFRDSEAARAEFYSIVGGIHNKYRS